MIRLITEFRHRKPAGVQSGFGRQRLSHTGRNCPLQFFDENLAHCIRRFHTFLLPLQAPEPNQNVPQRLFQ